MQHLDDDMEGLFQRAADKYELDPGPDSWERIAQKINESRVATPKTTTRNNNKRTLGILLLVVMLSGGLVIVLKNQSFQQQRNDGRKQATYSLVDKQQKGINSHHNTLPNKKIKASLNPNENSTAGLQNIGKTKDISSSKFTPRLIHTNNYEKSTQLQSPQKMSTSDQPFNAIKKDTDQETEVVQTGEQLSNADPKIHPAITNEDNKNNAVEQKKKATTPFKKELYLGVLAGGDFSKVKSMAFNKVGFSAGIVGEYKFAKRWSLQTGFIVNRKNYSGEGVDFNMNKVGTTMTGMTIEHFASHSTIVEVPLTAKYYLSRKPDHHFFIMAGIASYAMTTEENKYDVMHNGQHEKFAGYYKANNYRALAAATFSLGYQKKFTSNSAISVAPYFNAPLGGVGVGKLPVTSAGLRVVLGTRLR